MNSALQAKYETWLEKAVADPDLKPELEAMAGNEAKIEDAFYKDLTCILWPGLPRGSAIM